MSVNMYGYPRNSDSFESVWKIAHSARRLGGMRVDVVEDYSYLQAPSVILILCFWEYIWDVAAQNPPL